MEFLASVSAGSTTGNGITTGAINTTGANLIVVVTGCNAAGIVVTDSKGNTWTTAVVSNGAGGVCTMFYSVPSSVGAGHTFTATLIGSQPVICVSAFTSAASSPLDQINNQQGTTATQSTGNVLPAYFGELIVAGITHYDLMSVSAITDPLRIVETVACSPGNHFGAGMAYVIQASAAAKNPDWTLTGGPFSSSALIASFRSSGDTIAPNREVLTKAVAVGYPGQTYLSTLEEAVQAEQQSFYAQVEGWLGTDHNPDGTHAKVRAENVTSELGYTMAVWPTTSAASNGYVADGGYLARSTSSARYKKNIQDVTIDEARHVVMALRSVTYNGANVTYDDGQRHPGFIAETVVKAAPDLVTLDAQDRPDYVTYDRVAVYVVPVVQDHEGRISDVEKRLLKLEKSGVK